MKKTVPVALGERSYNIHIGKNQTRDLPRYLNAFPSRKAFIIADKKLLTARKQLLSSLKRGGWETCEIAVRAGESLKDFNSIYPIYGQLLTAKADRDSVLFALGGGSIGDAAGFIAATYLRGIHWVGLPTTLLAQVDSAVGGKTGINHKQGKNLIGSFHQPSLVVCDTEFLKTLSLREMISGLGEVIKYGLVFDRPFFASIQKNWQLALNSDPAVLAAFIQKSLQWKARVVARDEFDRKGIREALNFGHTFGHALEAVTGFGHFQHGEAVIWGMRFAVSLSRIHGSLSEKDEKQIQAFLKQIKLRALPVKVQFEEYLQHIAKDKKLRQGKVHFVLLKGIGKSYSDGGITLAELRAAFDSLGEKSS
jgi:3-dehydroquinate synthase